MKKKNIEIIATAFLIIALIFVSISSYKKIKGVISRTVVTGQNVEQAKVASASPVAATISKQAEGKLFKDWGRDPFSGVIYSVQGKDITLKFTGVLWDDNNPQALINGKIVGNNSTVGKYRVIKINRDSVILNDGVKDLEMHLGR